MSKKRNSTSSSESKFVNLNKKIDLIVTYFRRKNFKYKYYKNLLISLDLIELIDIYAKHVVIFDIYNKEKIEINENQHESVLKPKFIHDYMYLFPFQTHVLSSQKIETTHNFNLTLPQIQINENDNQTTFRFLVGIVSSIKTDLRSDILSFYYDDPSHCKGYFLTFFYPGRDIRMITLDGNSQTIFSNSLGNLQASMNNNVYIKKESCNEFNFYVNNKLVYKLKIENKQQSFYFCLSWDFYFGFFKHNKNFKPSWKIV